MTIKLISLVLIFWIFYNYFRHKRRFLYMKINKESNHTDNWKEEFIVEKSKEMYNKPLNYYELKKMLKNAKMTKELLDKTFFEIGEYKIKIIPVGIKNDVCQEDEIGTYAEYLEYKLEIIEENKVIDICKDGRFRNFIDFYRRWQENFKFNELFDALLLIEQMSKDIYSYKNKKYIIKFNMVLDKISILESNDETINELIKNCTIEGFLGKRKYCYLRNTNNGEFFIVRKEKNEYRTNYYSLFPIEVENLTKLIRYENIAINGMLVKKEVVNKLIKEWHFIKNDILDIYCSEAPWNIVMEGGYFDCSGYKSEINEWIERIKNPYLSLYIGSDGVVKEIYGNLESLKKKLGDNEQISYIFEELSENLKLVIQYNNIEDSKDNINSYVCCQNKIFYGDVIIMCQYKGDSFNISFDEIKNMFELGILDKRLSEQLNFYWKNELNNLRWKRDWNKTDLDNLLDEIETLEIPDGISKVLSYNERQRNYKKDEVDIFKIYKNIGKEELELIIKRRSGLFSYGYHLADAFLNMCSAQRRGEDKNRKYEREYESLKQEVMEKYPEFGMSTFFDAENDGMDAARW